MNLVLVLCNALLLVCGQLLWKFGLENRPHAFAGASAIVGTLLSPYVLAGVAIYGGATVLWLFILTRVPLSVAYPMQSVAYVIAMVAAHYLFGESITAAKVGGALLIMAGISLIAFSGSGTVAGS